MGHVRAYDVARDRAETVSRTPRELAEVTLKFQIHYFDHLVFD